MALFTSKSYSESLLKFKWMNILAWKVQAQTIFSMHTHNTRRNHKADRLIKEDSLCCGVCVCVDHKDSFRPFGKDKIMGVVKQVWLAHSLPPSLTQRWVRAQWERPLKGIQIPPSIHPSILCFDWLCPQP